MKFFNFDNIITTILVFLVLLIMPIFSGIEFLKPFYVHLINFELTDINYKEIGGKEHGDNRIIMVKNYGLSLAQLDSLIEKLNSGSSKPAVIALETIIGRTDGSEDAVKLKNNIAGYDNIVLADSLGGYSEDSGQFGYRVTNYAFQPGKTASGYKNLLIGFDKEFYTVRDYNPFYEFEGKEAESFSTAVIKKYDKALYDYLKSRDNETETINFKGGGFTDLDYEDIISENHKVDFNGKIVLIGTYDEESKDNPCKFIDLYFSPLNERYSGKSFPDQYGVEIQANIISMVLDKDFYTRVSNYINYLVALLFVYMNMVVFSYITFKNKKLYELMNLIIFVIESVFIFYISGLLYFGNNIEMDFTPTIFALILSVFAFEGYNDSLKPLAIKSYYKFIKKR